MWASLWNIYDGPSGASDSDAKPKSTARVRTSEAGKESGDAGRRIDEFPQNNFIQSSNAKQIVNLQEAADNTIILRGIIVGEEQSGKTSLIRRLRGENPFQQPGKNNERISAETGRKLMALLPWRLPDEAQFHKSQVIESDGLVQLYVSEGKSFCYSKKPDLLKKQMMSLFMQLQRGRGFDFAVWMVDPRMNKVLDYVHEGLEILFPSVMEQGNSCCEGRSQPIIQHVCILVNFRDVVPLEQRSDSNDGCLLEQIRLVVKNVVARNKEFYEKHRRGNSSDVLPTPTILVYESSMKNCYGLQNFLSFIALPYLSRKERDLRYLVDQTQKQRFVCERGLMEANHMDYSEFIKQKMREKEQSHQIVSLQKDSIERQMLEEEKERIQTHSERQTEIMRTTTQKQEVNNHVGKELERRVDRSSLAMNPQHFRPDNQVQQDIAPTTTTDYSDQQKVFVKRQLISDVKKAATTEIGRTTLETFFSDDDDEEDEQTEIETCNNSESSEGYDSDDGDFYIDGSGTRCVHANLPVSSKQSSSKLDLTPQYRQITKEFNSEKAVNDSSVLHNEEVDTRCSNDGRKDDARVKFKGSGSELAPPEAENSTDYPDPVVESKSSADRQDKVEIYTSTDAEVGEKLMACVSLVPLGTNAEERVDERTLIDATATLGYKDGTLTSNDQLPKGSIVATDNDDTIKNESLRDSDDEFKSNPIKSEIESGVKNDEKKEKNSSEHRHTPSDEHFVLNSDVELIGQSSESNGRRVSNDDCDDIAEELNNPDVNQELTTNLSLPRRTGNRGNSLPVSSAALAAIEAAKIEVEKMMAQSLSESQVNRGRKSKKKEKEGKKKKKKVKDKNKKQDN